MPITSIKIRNIRSVKDFEIRFDPDECAGWHVIIGDNGSGKSTVAKAIALGLVGASEALGLREDWGKWLRKQCKSGGIELTLKNGNADGVRTVGVRFDKNDSKAKTVKPKKLSSLRDFDGTDDPVEEHNVFSASYGPFRRFSGGGKDSEEKIKTSYPRLVPHLSLFGEGFALAECLEWIKELRFKQLEKKEEGNVLPLLKKFVNEGRLLPDGAIFKDVSSDEVLFKDPNGTSLAIGELSDGYRSVLSLTFDLIRQMVNFFGYGDVFRNVGKNKTIVDLPGVVVIDEIDAHLHPSWQKRIGYWFLEYFPNIQFFVTTHSPLICRAAEKGSVWRLAAPGSEQESGKVEGTDLQRLLFGNVLEALDTELFGTGVIRSETSRKKLERLKELNLLSIKGEISDQEEDELRRLRSIMPTSINAGISMEDL